MSIEVGQTMILDAVRRVIEEDRANFLPPLNDQDVRKIMYDMKKKLNKGLTPGAAWMEIAFTLKDRKLAWQKSKNGEKP